MQQPLISILYASKPAASINDETVSDLALRSMRKNRELAITGCLWYHPELFVQWIEGPASDIDALYGLILNDPRHHHVTLIERAEQTKRHYARWGLRLVPAEAGNTQEDAETWVSREMSHAISVNTPDEDNHWLQTIRRLLKIEPSF